MSEKQVWFITGAGRGMGVDFAKAALAAGTRGRRHRPHAPTRCGRPSGDAEDLLVVRAGRHRPGRGRGGRPGGGGAVRTHRRAGQQRRELLRRLLRGADPGADRATSSPPGWSGR